MTVVEQEHVPDLRPRPWVERREVGAGVALLTYEGGLVGVEHVCTRIRDGITVLNAPRLQLGIPDGHRIVQADPPTITPSLLCGDCGLHGFVADGVWTPVPAAAGAAGDQP